MKRRSVAGLVIATALAYAPPVPASPADLFGFGPRSQALAGSGAALASGSEATYGNPALLSDARSRQVTLGWQAARFELRADGPEGPGAVPADAVQGTLIGLVLPVPFGGVLQDRVALGLGAFTPSDVVARARLLYPERAQFPLLTDRAQTLNLAIGAGFDLGYGVRVGVGALALAELVGTVVVRTDASGRVGTIVDDQLVATYAPVVGAAYDFGDGFTAGGTFRGALEGEFDVLVQVFDLGSLVVPDLHISGIAQYDPLQLELGLGRRVGAWTFGVGATYKHWSAFDGWRRPTVVCPSDEPDCAALRETPVDFHDTIVPRVAVARSIELSTRAKASVRGGVFWEPTPAPAQNGLANYWDNDRVALTFGYGVALQEPLELRIDAVWQYHHLLVREHEKTASARAAGALPARAETSGSVQLFAIAAEVGF
ncbi:MAG: outer membrane protein transport protein [Polyangiaceae bacterium]|nr:outer membrane protein transport protein [Polyangiaceae bacterium]